MEVIAIFAFMLVITFSSSVSAVRINEVELNPAGSSDSGNEWIELYSDSLVNLTNWWIMSSNGRNMSFNASFSGFYTFNTSTYLLTDENITLVLANETKEIIYSTDNLTDKENDIRSWQYCNENWSFVNSTREQENLCTIQNITQNTTSNQTNSTNQTNTTQNTTQEAEEYIELEDRTYIQNGKTLNIEIKTFNLKNNSYDVKVAITFKENDTIISETYNENESEWKSSTYYLSSFISGSGNKTSDIEIRIDDKYRKFYGKALINAKLRLNNVIIDEFEDNINVTEQEETNAVENEIILGDEAPELVVENPGIIKLNQGKDIKTQEIWKSKEQYIKEYSIYGFTLLFSVFITIILLIKNGRKK